MDNFDDYAIITIRRGKVHLDMTFNSDANEPIQIEHYASNGWTICQHCPALAYAFPVLRSLCGGGWSVWSECNAHTAGGIYLTDNQSPARVRAILRRFSHTYHPSQIAALKDGRYLINASDHFL